MTVHYKSNHIHDKGLGGENILPHYQYNLYKYISCAEKLKMPVRG